MRNALRRLVVPIVLLLALVGASGGALAQPGDAEPRKTREREILRERTSGFWTSNRPAQGGAYRWRMLAIGGGLVVVTGLLMLRVTRKASAARKAGHQSQV